MEVKINKEIRNYTESIYFGLSLRQFFFSMLACILSIFIFFLFRDKLNIEIVSWICIFSVVPCAILGFLNYNGMPPEKIIWAFIKSNILVPKRLMFQANNFYYELLKDKINQERNDNNENIKEII